MSSTNWTWLAPTINVGVKAELGDDMDRASITFLLQHLRCFTISRQRCRCMLIVVELNLAEWRRVATIEVLPGKKKRTRLVLLCQTHGLKSGKIIRLLINMDHLWTYLVHNLTQFRIVVQMEIAIESHISDNHTIAIGIEAFEHLFTAIIALPVRRRNQG